ncbi:isocitrate lyase/PEP mutase family protein [Sphingobium sp. CR2-8]|uniref:isocitrate lyase/PEP mutase family protein n=1 Tax=Sphingobium sp. CR2-8 TaxID=1306534 RepID=UPI002DB571DE|nr:isocitrate lyase/PEP mutase family protein [Sphingobium sp. CR2-8]MEC3909607.1 isocitrate lyase/PEP mutase family protein [Sphingobium sp. CR2-8]
MTTRLRALLRDKMVVAPGCFDPLSARLAQLAGFEAVHMTGLGVEASQLAAPDLGLLSMREIADHSARMTAALDIPVMADIDTGFGGVLNVQRTIREMERAGVAGVHIEDQIMPKHCPLLAGRSVVSRAAALDRLKAALDARTDPDFVIAARSDADTISFDELVERSNLYLEAGADLAMPVLMTVEGRSFFSLLPAEQMEWNRKLVAAIDGPVMGMGSGPPLGYTEADLADAGFKLIMYAATALGVAANAMAALFRDMKAHGTDSLFIAANPGAYHDPLELMRAARLDDYVATEKRFMSAED